MLNLNSLHVHQSIQHTSCVCRSNIDEPSGLFIQTDGGVMYIKHARLELDFKGLNMHVKQWMDIFGLLLKQDDDDINQVVAVLTIAY